MRLSDLRDLIRSCERESAASTVVSAARHGPVRIWRETVDHQTGAVTIEAPTTLSPLTLALNRLYTGVGLAMTRRAPRGSERR